MRSFAFNVAYWILSIGYGLTAAFAALAPGRGPASWVIRRYVKRMVQAMSIFAGIKLDCLRAPSSSPQNIKAGAMALRPMTSSTTSPSSPAIIWKSFPCWGAC
jgi:hypothetical protein